MNATVIYVGVRALKSFVSYNRTIFHKSCAPSWPSHHSLVPIEHLKCIGTRYNAARRPLRLPVVFTQSPTTPTLVAHASPDPPTQHVRVRRLPPHKQFWLVATPNAATEASHSLSWT